MPFTLPDLPYAQDALAPYMGLETLQLHHGKHHQTYVTNLNNLIEGTELAGKSLEEIVVASAKDPAKVGIFNNAGQHWNHNLFWRVMKKNGGGKPGGELAKRIDRDFGSYDAFAEQFKQAGVTQFGSGWAWLSLDGDKLKVSKSPNGSNPLVDGLRPILGIDVWEHAYYLDYRNRRPDYIAAFLNHLVNWEEVEAELHKATGG
ncbi:MAG: superoxide dismutase [Geminicoccaceae bacterium]